MLGGRNNNFNLIRIIAATSVLASHAFTLVHSSAPRHEPLVDLTGQSLGYFAVAVFFGISGLLIARSFDRRSSIWHFGLSRVLRLWPALLVVLFLTAVVLGPLMTTKGLHEYFTSPQFWSYIPKNLTLYFMQYNLPGVFPDNNLPGTINGSLWTLAFEFICYCGVVFVGYLGFLKSKPLFLGFLVFVTIAYSGSVFGLPFAVLGTRLGRLALPFALGMAAYVFRDQIRLGPLPAIILWLIVLALSSSPLFATAIQVALVYTVFWLALVPKGKILLYNRLGDYSYGVYIYAFPTQQTVAALFPHMSALENILVSLPLTLMLALFSWVVIEKPSLDFARSMRGHLSDWPGSMRLRRSLRKEPM